MLVADGIKGGEAGLRMPTDVGCQQTLDWTDWMPTDVDALQIGEIINPVV